jgi:hypothetical protein
MKGNKPAKHTWIKGSPTVKGAISTYSRAGSNHKIHFFGGVHPFRYEGAGGLTNFNGLNETKSFGEYFA